MAAEVDPVEAALGVGWLTLAIKTWGPAVARFFRQRTQHADQQLKHAQEQYIDQRTKHEKANALQISLLKERVENLETTVAALTKENEELEADRDRERAARHEAEIAKVEAEMALKVSEQKCDHILEKLRKHKPDHEPPAIAL